MQKKKIIHMSLWLLLNNASGMVEWFHERKTEIFDQNPKCYVQQRIITIHNAVITISINRCRSESDIVMPFGMSIRIVNVNIRIRWIKM